MTPLRLILIVLALLAGGNAEAAELALHAERTIRAGQAVTPSAVRLAPVASAKAYLQDVEEIDGMEARRTLYKDQPIRADDLAPEALIERQQLVRLAYDRDGLRISTVGRALGRAGYGEPVRVMNMTSRKVVIGVATEAGLVEVGDAY